MINAVPEPAQYSVFMSCYEMDDRIDSSTFTSCATQAGIDTKTQATIQTCARPGAQGDAIEATNAKATISLGASKLGTPWVMVNGKNLDDPTTLLQAVCDAYTGDLPPGCK